MKILSVCVLFSVFVTGAYAGLNKCTGADGKITFSDVLCPSTSNSVKVQERDNSLDSSGSRQQMRASSQGANGDSGPDSQACTNARQAMASATQTKIDIRAERVNVNVLCSTPSASDGSSQKQNRAQTPQCAQARQAYAYAVDTKLDVRSEKSDVEIMCGVASPPKTTLRCRDIGSGITKCR